MLKQGDALLIAGKGHEIGQIVGETGAAVQRRRRSARGFAGGGMSALWTEGELATALGGAPSAALTRAVAGVSIDTRTLEPGDLFFAIKGETHDGHDHVARAFEAGAPAAVVSRERADALAAFGPVFAVDDTLEALERLGVASRARTKARIVAVTGSVGKTSAKEMLRVMLSACGAHACLRRLLQQPLGRAADARAHAERAPTSACSRSA